MRGIVPATVPGIGAGGGRGASRKGVTQVSNTHVAMSEPPTGPLSSHLSSVTLQLSSQVAVFAAGVIVDL